MDTCHNEQFNVGSSKTMRSLRIYFVIFAIVFSPFGCATLLQFELTGAGELYDANYQPVNGGSSVEMLLSFQIDSQNVLVNNSSLGNELVEFEMIAGVTNINLIVGGNHYTSLSSVATFLGVAVSQGLDTWENYFSVGIGGEGFSVTQWIGQGVVNSDNFATVNGVSNYYNRMVGNANGLWGFKLSDTEQYLGGLKQFSITEQAVVVSEANSFFLLSVGLYFLFYSRNSSVLHKIRS